MKLNISEMEEIARIATKGALRHYPPPVDFDRIVLGSRLEDSHGEFELYIPGERPEDATLISCARVDRGNGAVEVEVFLEGRSEVATYSW